MVIKCNFYCDSFQFVFIDLYVVQLKLLYKIKSVILGKPPHSMSRVQLGS